MTGGSPRNFELGQELEFFIMIRNICKSIQGETLKSAGQYTWAEYNQLFIVDKSEEPVSGNNNNQNIEESP